MKSLQETVESIAALDVKAQKKAGERLDTLVKPPRSLGVLEELAQQVAGIQADSRPVPGEKSVVVMAADHGVVEEGVSAAPQEITRQMLPNFVKGVAGVGVLARHAGARLVVIDIGTAGEGDIPGVLNKKVRSGTGNIARGPAMTKDEAVKSIEIGIDAAVKEVEKGAGMLATGEMGIGNTTPSSAILAAAGGYSPGKVTGRGTFVNDDVMEKKTSAIERALEINNPDPSDGIDILSKVGGLEIAGLAGLILGAASCRVPVLVDGFISTAAAVIASLLSPRSRDYMIASHLSEEPGHKLMLDFLELKPMLHMDMRLGEGTGAVLAFNLVEAACKILNEMATFEEAKVMEIDKNLLYS